MLPKCRCCQIYQVCRRFSILLPPFCAAPFRYRPTQPGRPPPRIRAGALAVQPPFFIRPARSRRGPKGRGVADGGTPVSPPRGKTELWQALGLSLPQAQRKPSQSMGAGCQQNGPFAPSRPWAKGMLRGESLPGKPLCGFGLPPNPTEAAGAAAREPQGGFPTPCKPPQRAACAGCRKSGLRHFFEVFIAPLRLRRGQGAMQGNPCYARLFADLPYMPPNPIKA